MGEREGAREEEGSVKGGTERTAHKFRVRGRGGARGRRHGSSTGHRRATDTHVFLVGRRALLEQILVLSKPVGEEEEEEEEGWWCHRVSKISFSSGRDKNTFTRLPKQPGSRERGSSGQARRAGRGHLQCVVFVLDVLQRLFLALVPARKHTKRRRNQHVRQGARGRGSNLTCPNGEKNNKLMRRNKGARLTLRG